MQSEIMGNAKWKFVTSKKRLSITSVVWGMHYTGHVTFCMCKEALTTISMDTFQTYMYLRVKGNSRAVIFLLKQNE